MSNDKFSILFFETKQKKKKNRKHSEFPHTYVLRIGCLRKTSKAPGQNKRLPWEQIPVKWRLTWMETIETPEMVTMRCRFFFHPTKREKKIGLEQWNGNESLSIFTSIYAFVYIGARGLTVIIANVFAAIYGTICVLWSVLMNYTSEIDVECQWCGNASTGSHTNIVYPFTTTTTMTRVTFNLFTLH